MARELCTPRSEGVYRGANLAVRGFPWGSAMSMAATSSSAMFTSTPGDAASLVSRLATGTARPRCRATSVFDLRPQRKI